MGTRARAHPVCKSTFTFGTSRSVGHTDLVRSVTAQLHRDLGRRSETRGFLIVSIVHCSTYISALCIPRNTILRRHLSCLSLAWSPVAMLRALKYGISFRCACAIHDALAVAGVKKCYNMFRINFLFAGIRTVNRKCHPARGVRTD